ncbi:MAG: hypothetical protein KJ964_12265 [Verrucomicrobia bacterium]|nr:hypothetical protein [Verrucomicrobiota bacterium]MBU1733996.1 hypothetical protein [Verrucomicrobiota bacterium]MBU1856650.1 hypothetical protein [Verrucomicrobiota bacterium]
MTAAEIAQRLNAKPTGPGKWTALCQAHKDKNPSLSISEGKDGHVLLHCHAGCTTEAVVTAMGLKMCDLMPPVQDKPGQIVKTYNYTDATGKLLFQVVRFDPKGFRQRRPDGNGGWVWNMQGIDRVLYRMPGVIKAKQAGHIIYITEGEKDADAIIRLGLCATCNPGGAGKWHGNYTSTLTGAQVIIIADKDEPGRKHAALVRDAIKSKAASVQVIELPDRNGRKVKDAADWIQAGGTADELQDILRNAPAFIPASDDAKATKTDQDNYKIIVLPGASVSITSSAENIFRRIAPSHELFIRGGAVMELKKDDNGGLRLDVLLAQAFRSRIEKLGAIFIWRVGKAGYTVLKPTTCPADIAEALLASEPAADLLPKVRGLAACPVLAEVDNHAQVLAKGYHSVNGGLLITAGKKPPELKIEEAIKALQLLVADFDFSTPSDRSRALASFITPALRIGGWLRGHIPIDIAEADQSQSGKTYRQKLVFALYGEEPYRIALRDGGVGGLDESIAQALIAGRPFIQVDNVRGRLESQFIEMMTTAGGTVGARVPHRGEVQVDSRHFILMMTSNGVETTRDLANRASIIRIRKRPGYVFHEFPEGDLLDHVRANHSHFLGAVFAVIRVWHGAGKPLTTDTRHDFREWSQVLGWIVKNILGEAPLMDGHEQAQERVSNPALTWLRRAALAVEADQRLDEEIMASSIGELCDAHGIEIPGLRDASDEIGRNKRIGVLMKKAFGDVDHVEIDRYRIKRAEKELYYTASQEYKMVKAYVFTLADADSPEHPELPEQAIQLPEKGCRFLESTDPYSGGSGNDPVEDEERAAIQSEGSLNL